jgi:hypothetical protein
MIGQKTSDTAVRASRIDRFVYIFKTYVVCRHQRARGTGLYAFTAANTRTLAKGITQIEDDLRMSTAKGQPNYIVHLLLAAGSDATGTLDATLQLNCDRRMGNIRTGLSAAAKTACTHVEFVAPLIKFRCLGVAGFTNLATQ